MSVTLFIFVCVVFGLGYLAGSIPFGLVLPKAAGHGDVRATGSGNIGATNVLRLAGRKMAAAVLACDLLKGTAGVLLGGLVLDILVTDFSAAPFGAPENSLLVGGAAGGLGAFLGHLYPVWLKFKGGKGVATLIGVLLGLDWRLAIMFCLCWLAVACLGRISSLAALVATALVFFAGWWLEPPVVAAAISVMSLLVVLRHHENIARLKRGEEPKIGASKGTAGSNADGST